MKRKPTGGGASQAKLNQAKKRREKDKLVSDILEKNFSSEISWFKDTFPGGRACERALLRWRGWSVKGKVLRFTCPECGGAAAYVYPKKSRKKKADAFQCMNPECRKQISLTSGTLFHKTRSPLWFWFLSMYAMALLDGQRPVKFLVKECQAYAVSSGMLMTVTRAQIEKMTTCIRKVAFRNSTSMSKSYLNMIALYRNDDFIKWYDSKHQLELFVGWRTRVHPKNNKIAVDYAQGNGLPEVDYVHYTKGVSGINKYKWLLCFKIKDNSIGNIRWMYIDEIEKLRPHKGKYILQAIQLEQGKNKLRRPFVITKKFKTSFSKAIEKYGVDNFKQISDNNIFSCPAELLDFTAAAMKCEI
ncbi:MAG: transposase [Desulfobulbaceae bacterium]